MLLVAIMDKYRTALREVFSHVPAHHLKNDFYEDGDMGTVNTLWFLRTCGSKSVSPSSVPLQRSFLRELRTVA